MLKNVMVMMSVPRQPWTSRRIAAIEVIFCFNDKWTAVIQSFSSTTTVLQSTSQRPLIHPFTRRFIHHCMYWFNEVLTATITFFFILQGLNSFVKFSKMLSSHSHLSYRVTGGSAGADPSSHWAKAGDDLDESPYYGTTGEILIYLKVIYI